jgi:hypothetical protein
MAASTWRNRLELRPIVARVRRLFDRQPTVNELAPLQLGHHGLTLGAQARVHPRCHSHRLALPAKTGPVQLGGVRPRRAGG